MKVVRSLASYLQSRGLLTEEDLEVLKRKGFLESIEPDDLWLDQFPVVDVNREEDAGVRELPDVEAVPARPRSRGRQRRPEAGLAELEAALNAILPDLESDLTHLQPLARDLKIQTDSSDWPRLFQESGDALTRALRNALANGKLKFDRLWRIIGEDPWRKVRPPSSATGPAWSAWRVLLSSRDGVIPTPYRWILRSHTLRRVFQRIELQRALIRGTAALFEQEPDVLWRAVTRPYHAAGFLTLSFIYTASANRERGNPIQAEFKVDLPDRPCFGLAPDGRVAVALPGGQMRLYYPGGDSMAVRDDSAGGIEALAFHPSNNYLYVSRTDSTGVNRVYETDLSSGTQRQLLEAFAGPQGHVCIENVKSLLAYRPTGADGFRFFERDASSPIRYISSPYPIHPRERYGFLPGGRYFGALLARTPIQSQYRVWDWSQGTVARTFELGSQSPANGTVIISESRNLLAYCTMSSSEIFNLEDMSPVAHHEGDPFGRAGYWFSGIFSSDGRWIVKWTINGDLQVWDWASGNQPVNFKEAPAALRYLTIDGIFLTGLVQSEGHGYEIARRRKAKRDEIFIWNIETGELYRPEFCQQMVNDVGVLWSVPGKLALLRYHRRSATAPPTRRIPGIRMPSDKPFYGLSLEVWSPFPGERKALQLTQDEQPGDLLDAWLFPDHDTVILRFRAGEAIELVDFSVPEERITSRRRFSVPAFHDAAGSYDDVCLGSGRQIDFYHPTKVSKTEQWDIPIHTRPANSLDSSEGALLVCCDGQSVVRIDLGTATQSAEAILPPAAGPHYLLARDPAGQNLRVASGHLLRTIRFTDGGPEVRIERELPADTQAWAAVPDIAQSKLAFGGDGQLKLLDLNEPQTFPVFLHPADGGGDWIPTFSPCGRFLAAARKDEFRMWTSDGQPLHRRVFFSEKPIAVRYSPTGDAIWILDDNGSFWKITVANLPPPHDTRNPVWELPAQDILMKSWTLAQLMAGTGTAAWLPLVAAICNTADPATRFAYGDLGLLAPATWAHGPD